MTAACKGRVCETHCTLMVKFIIASYNRRATLHSTFPSVQWVLSLSLFFTSYVYWVWRGKLLSISCSNSCWSPRTTCNRCRNTSSRAFTQAVMVDKSLSYINVSTLNSSVRVSLILCILLFVIFVMKLTSTFTLLFIFYLQLGSTGALDASS